MNRPLLRLIWQFFYIRLTPQRPARAEQQITNTSSPYIKYDLRHLTKIVRRPGIAFT